MNHYLKVNLAKGQFSSEYWVTFNDYMGGSIGLFCDKNHIREQYDGSGLMEVKEFEPYPKNSCTIVTLPKHIVASDFNNDSRFVCVKNVQLVKI